MFVAYINIITMKRRDFLKNAGRVASSAAILGSSSVVLNAAETEPEKFPVHEIVEDELNANLDKTLTAIVIGAGARGSIYTQYDSLYPNSLKVVGVSDINEFRRSRMADQFHVPAENRMGDWSEVFKRPKFADLVFITTPDALHYKPCMKALEMGYHVLLDKEMKNLCYVCSIHQYNNHET